MILSCFPERRLQPVVDILCVQSVFNLLFTMPLVFAAKLVSTEAFFILVRLPCFAQLLLPGRFEIGRNREVVFYDPGQEFRQGW